MNDNTIGIIITTIVVIVFVACVVYGWGVHDMQDEAVHQGKAQYNSTTGQFEWNSINPTLMTPQDSSLDFNNFWNSTDALGCGSESENKVPCEIAWKECCARHKTNLTAASEVIEKCDRAFEHSYCACEETTCAQTVALAAIKSWKDK